MERKLDVGGSKFESSIGKSNFIIFKKNGKILDENITSITNLWGVENNSDRISDKALALIKESNDSLIFYGKASNIKCRNICGYPSIRIGKSPWDKRDLFEIGQVKKYDKIEISTHWAFKANGEFANFVYDIWITKNKDGYLTEDDIELMVWLDKNKEFKSWEDFGNFKGFNVRFTKKTSNWNNGGFIFAFIYLNKNNKRKFDLIKLIDYCKKKIANVKCYYIRSIELGTEFAKNTEVQVKLKKAEVNFVTK
jgi:hypothetical protein